MLLLNTTSLVGETKMSTTITYPGSRANVTQCKVCNRNNGYMLDSGRINLDDASGKSIELMKLTCNRCGYTVLFDLDIPRNHPFDSNDYEEILAS
jgi:predicted nucleic-acid-binding Zn-ribbon protein